MVPSVCFAIDIPESIEGSWYTGKALIGFKDAVFEPSSPQRHSAELHNVLLSNDVQSNPILFLYILMVALITELLISVYNSVQFFCF